MGGAQTDETSAIVDGPPARWRGRTTVQMDTERLPEWAVRNKERRGIVKTKVRCRSFSS
jgi:hypothetical protein